MIVSLFLKCRSLGQDKFFSTTKFDDVCIAIYKAKITKQIKIQAKRKILL